VLHTQKYERDTCGIRSRRWAGSGHSVSEGLRRSIREWEYEVRRNEIQFIVRRLRRLGEQDLRLNRQEGLINVDIKREIADIANHQAGAWPLMLPTVAGIHAARVVTGWVHTTQFQACLDLC